MFRKEDYKLSKYLNIEDFIIFTLILFSGILLHWFLKSEIIISNSDDLKSLYRGFVSINGGINKFFETTTDLATKQGRFYFVYTDFFSHLPYLISSDWLRSLTITIIFCLSGLCVSYYIYFLTNRVKISQLFFILYLTCLPVYGSWYAYYHWPIYWFLPIIFFTIAVIFWNLSFYLNQNKVTEILSLVLYISFCFLAILFSEMYFIFFGILILLFLLKKIYPNKKITLKLINNYRYLISKWKILIASFLPFIIYLIFYLDFLINKSEKYSRVSSKLSFNFDPIAILNTLKGFIVAAFPINLLTLSQAKRYIEVQIHSFANGEHTIWIVTILSIVLLSFLSSCLFVYILKFGNEDKASSLEIKSGYPLWFKLSLTLFLGYIFISIHTITGLYQNWISNIRPWYTPVFHLSASFCIVIVIILEHYSALHRNISSKTKFYVSLMIIFVLSVMISSNIFSTLSVKKVLKSRNMVWHLMYQLKNSKLAKVINDNETVYFKKLHDAPKLERSQIFSEFVRKSVKVYPDSKNFTLKHYNWIFEIKYGFHDEDVYLLAGKPIGKKNNVFEFREAWIIPYTGLKTKDPFIFKNGKCIDIKTLKKRKKSIYIKAEEKFSIQDVFLKVRSRWYVAKC